MCLSCGGAFTIDETGYADILKQVRDTDSEKQLHERLELDKDRTEKGCGYSVLVSAQYEQELALVCELDQRSHSAVGSLLRQRARLV